MLTRIFHTDRDEEAAQHHETRQTSMGTQGCMRHLENSFLERTFLNELKKETNHSSCQSRSATHEKIERLNDIGDFSGIKSRR